MIMLFEINNKEWQTDAFNIVNYFFSDISWDIIMSQIPHSILVTFESQIMAPAGLYQSFVYSDEINYFHWFRQNT